METIRVYWQKGMEEAVFRIVPVLELHFPMLSPLPSGELELLRVNYDGSRYQYDAAGLLRQLPKEGVCLYLVGADLYYPGYRYLYGAAAQGRAVVSDFRSDTKDGYEKEVCHELGHALGLEHCRRNCIMHVSRSEQALEKKHFKFCSHCRNLLEKAAGLQKIKE